MINSNESKRKSELDLCRFVISRPDKNSASKTPMMRITDIQFLFVLKISGYLHFYKNH
jgi:hypothetical protein